MAPWRIRVYGLLVGWMVLLLAALWWSQQLNVGRIVARQLGPDGGTVDLVSSAYKLDRVYMSMEGPRSNQPQISLTDRSEATDTIWLTGVETHLVENDSWQHVSNEFFCHSNLTFNPNTTTPQKHNSQFEDRTHADWRLFTLVPGRMQIELPAGFGIPLKPTTQLDYFTMALNQNAGQPERTVRMRTTIKFQNADAGSSKLKPLFRRALYVYQQHAQESTSPTLAGHQDATHQGEICAENCDQDLRGSLASQFATLDVQLHPGATCCVENASIDGVVTQFGTENTVHWMVPPGRYTYRTDVTNQMQLPFDTTIHYVTGHLHPFGQTLRLIDSTDDQVVAEIVAEGLPDRLGVKSMSEIKSSEGIQLHENHKYELVAEYDNRLDHPIDAMGILFFYAQDEALSTDKSRTP